MGEWHEDEPLHVIGLARQKRGHTEAFLHGEGSGGWDAFVRGLLLK